MRLGASALFAAFSVGNRGRDHGPIGILHMFAPDQRLGFGKDIGMVRRDIARLPLIG